MKIRKNIPPSLIVINLINVFLLSLSLSFFDNYPSVRVFLAGSVLVSTLFIFVLIWNKQREEAKLSKQDLLEERVRIEKLIADHDKKSKK